MTVAQEQDTRILKLRLIFHGSHCFTNTQTNLLLPRKNDSTIYEQFIRHVNTKILWRKISFTGFYIASQYQILIKKDFLYKNLSDMPIQKSNEGRFAL